MLVSGPLLYHFYDMDKELSIELSYEELKHVIKQLKFDIIVSAFHTSVCVQLKIIVMFIYVRVRHTSM